MPETLRGGTIAPTIAVSPRRYASNRTLTEEPITYGRAAAASFQQLGTETLIDLMLMRRVTISLKRSNEGAQPRREDDQITGTWACTVGVCHTCGYKYGRPRPEGSSRSA